MPRPASFDDLSRYYKLDHEVIRIEMQELDPFDDSDILEAVIKLINVLKLHDSYYAAPGTNVTINRRLSEEEKKDRYDRAARSWDRADEMYQAALKDRSSVQSYERLTVDSHAKRESLEAIDWEPSED